MFHCGSCVGTGRQSRGGRVCERDVFWRRVTARCGVAPFAGPAGVCRCVPVCAPMGWLRLTHAAIRKARCRVVVTIAVGGDGLTVGHPQGRLSVLYWSGAVHVLKPKPLPRTPHRARVNRPVRPDLGLHNTERTPMYPACSPSGLRGRMWFGRARVPRQRFDASSSGRSLGPLGRSRHPATSAMPCHCGPRWPT